MPSRHRIPAGIGGPSLKFAGYDLIIFEGRAQRPSYLFIYDDLVELRDAAAYWGKTVPETEDGLRSELGISALRVACIGPAGENLVKFACIMNDKHRAAGRSGVGTVMGSKKPEGNRCARHQGSQGCQSGGFHESCPGQCGPE